MEGGGDSWQGVCPEGDRWKVLVQAFGHNTAPWEWSGQSEKTG